MKNLPVLFEQHEIRRVYDEKKETWFFFGGGHRSSAHATAGFPGGQEVLEQAQRAAWEGGQSTGDKLSPVQIAAMKGHELVTNCYQLKMLGAGKTFIVEGKDE